MNRIYKINIITILNRQFSTKLAPKSNTWKSVIGLEIHAQIASESKLFSGSRNSFSAEINSSVSLLDAAIPGCLPVLNRRCVEAGIKTALALNCEINEVSMFDRKHYFYSDLPAGYQITQQRKPLARKGFLTFPVLTPVKQSKAYYKTVRLHQLQLEQDSGKSLHDEELKISLIDLNRAGIPLMELVFEPDLSDGEEAAALVKELILIFERIQTCNCRMEEGQLRVDANVSINKEGEELGVRTEIKNIGSIRGVAQAIEYEIQRQISVKDQGGVIINETRQWNAVSKTTIAMRDKEVVQDYRYMPEPNLLPLHLNMTEDVNLDDLVSVKAIEKSLPILPQELRDELVNDHKLTQVTAMILVNDTVIYNLYKDIIKENPKRSAKTVSNVLINDYIATCNKNKIYLEDSKISSSHLGEIIDMLENQELNHNLVKLVLQKLFETSQSPKVIVEENQWKQISDDAEIIKYCNQVLESENGKKMVQQYKSGKTKVLFAIAGEINKISNNRINMAKVTDMLKNILK
ncbi:hypothetical protein PVAND_009789 [Polypedilum vanderplanki]|uniref:Glutamyl-tRNA(Gln) amidotransferase subunit B, mitochondrial n=1 Tax=Polypedilum vanderplanki TaxID=319348 RepID=A0A9J6CF74_POLVA|nr:hypothetical protein PVAND_009789 [Polypedilum vanderplanki]